MEKGATETAPGTNGPTQVTRGGGGGGGGGFRGRGNMGSNRGFEGRGR